MNFAVLMRVRHLAMAAVYAHSLIAIIYSKELVPGR